MCPPSSPTKRLFRQPQGPDDSKDNERPGPLQGPHTIEVSQDSGREKVKIGVPY